MPEKFSRQKFKNLQFVGIYLESYPYREIKLNSCRFFARSHKFVSDISGVFEGRHYNHGLLIHKFNIGALWRLYWDGFVKFVIQYKPGIMFFRWLLKNSTNYSHYFIALTWMGLHWVKLSRFGFNTGACFFASELITGNRNSDWSLHLETFTKMLLYDRAYNHGK